MDLRPSVLVFLAAVVGETSEASVLFTLISLDELRDTSVDTPLLEVATWTI